VINPIRSESRSAESWRGLLARIRHLLLGAYNRTLIRFEEVIRDQRERRNELGWSFCQYFLLQVIPHHIYTAGDNGLALQPTVCLSHLLEV
jgi:hypothetical protein